MAYLKQCYGPLQTFLDADTKKIKCLTSFTYDKIFSLTLKLFLSSYHGYSLQYCFSQIIKHFQSFSFVSILNWIVVISSFSLASWNDSLVVYNFVLFKLIFFAGIFDVWLLPLIFPTGLLFLKKIFFFRNALYVIFQLFL